MTNLANRPPLGQKRPKHKPNPAHLERVKGLPCVICGAPPPSDAHHVICGRYGSRKAPDEDTIPLCKAHHQWGPDAIHNGKESWITKYGPDYGCLPVVAAMLNGKVGI